MTEDPRPLLLYDGACGFCRAWVDRWRRVTGGRVRFAPYQEADARCAPIPPGDLERAVHLVEPDGRITRGAEAVVRSLATVPGQGWALWMYRFIPGAAALGEAGYAWVARHRPRGGRTSG